MSMRRVAHTITGTPFDLISQNDDDDSARNGVISLSLTNETMEKIKKILSIIPDAYRTQGTRTHSNNNNNNNNPLFGMGFMVL